MAIFLERMQPLRAMPQAVRTSKPARCYLLNPIPARSGAALLVSRDAERGCRRRLERSPDVAVGLRLPEPPERRELPDRIVGPVDAQIGDRPLDRFRDEQSGRAHRPFLATGG